MNPNEWWLIKAVVRLTASKKKECVKQRVLQQLEKEFAATSLEAWKKAISEKLTHILSNNPNVDHNEVNKYVGLQNSLLEILWDISNSWIFIEWEDFTKQGPNQIFMNNNLKRLTEANGLSWSLQYAISTFLWCKAYRQADGSMKVFRLKDHIQRLRSGVQALWLGELEYSDTQLEEAMQWVADNSAGSSDQAWAFDSVYLRPYAWSDVKNYSISGKAMQWYVDVIFEAEYFDYLGKDQKLIIPNHIIRDELYPDQKLSAQYDKIRAVQDSIDPTQHTGWLLLDKEGNIAEMAANIFFIDGEGTLITPKTGTILPGYTRDAMIAIAKVEWYTVRERDIKPEELKEFIGCFTTGTASAAKAVASIEYQWTTISFDCAHDTIKNLQDKYMCLVQWNLSSLGDKESQYTELLKQREMVASS
jgi:branched-chain amino acid aminotransferase